jgi:D-glycero-alpha-D-manno-heptose 1-phosphate guanylyltransferase
VLFATPQLLEGKITLPSNTQFATSDIKVLLLVGGMGTRLRSVVPNAPKPLAAVGKKSFLELLVQQLRNQGFRNLIMCSGYLANQIEREFGNGSKFDLSIEYSCESSPMGTGGAVKLAERSFLNSASTFIVMNGDSFVEVDIRDSVAFHRVRGSLLTMVVRSVENAGRYGTVQVDEHQRITGFSEKTGNPAPGLVNAGVYVFERAVLQQLPEGPSSLERDLFPRLLHQGIYAKQTKGIFVDIGTPEDYVRAQQICDRLYNAASNHTD